MSIATLITAVALAGPPEAPAPSPQVREWLHTSPAGRTHAAMANWGEHGVSKRMEPSSEDGFRALEQPLVVAQKGDRWRLVYYLGHVRVLVRVEVTDVARVTTVPVDLQSKFMGKTKKGAKTHIRLGPGIVVEQDDPRDGWVEVDVVDDRITTSGWVEWTVVEKAWEGNPFEPPDEGFDDVERWCLGERVSVHDKPKDKARVLATAGPWAPDCPRKVVKLAPDEDGWSFVWWYDDDLSVRGYVPTSGLEKPILEERDACALAKPPAWCSDPDPDLAVDGGTWLYDTPDGEAIGLVMRDTKLHVQQAGGSWQSAKLRSPWGWLTVWVPPG